MVAGPCVVSMVPVSLPPVFFRLTVSGISPNASLLAMPSYLPEMSAAALSSEARLLNDAANAADEINSAIESTAKLLRNCIFQSPDGGFRFCNQANLHLRMTYIQGHIFITQNARASKQFAARA